MEEVDATATSVTLSWQRDVISDERISGYMVYYKRLDDPTQSIYQKIMFVASERYIQGFRFRIG